MNKKRICIQFCLFCVLSLVSCHVFASDEWDIICCNIAKQINNENCCFSDIADWVVPEDGGHGICCAKGSSKVYKGGFNKACCENAGGKVIDTDKCCGDFAVTRSVNGSAPMCPGTP